jgi:hypothetical protein
MFSIGKTKPEKNIMGSMKKKIAVIIACCCVREIVEIKSPNPSVVMRKMRLRNRSRSTPPFTGRLKTSDAKNTTRTTSITPIRKKGASLPIIS